MPEIDRSRMTVKPVVGILRAMDRAGDGHDQNGTVEVLQESNRCRFGLREHSRGQTVHHGLPFTMSCLFAMNTRKQVYDSTLDDLLEYAVWEFALDEDAHDGQDEATVKLYDIPEALDPSDGMFVVRASFVLADGSEHARPSTSPSVDSADFCNYTTDHCHRTRSGRILVRHCLSIIPAVNSTVQALYCAARQVFPLTFESQVQLVGGPVRGSLEGFMVLEDLTTRKAKTLT